MARRKSVVAQELDDRLARVQELLQVQAETALAEQHKAGKQLDVNYSELYSANKGPWWRHVSAGGQLSNWSTEIEGKIHENLRNAPGKNMPNSSLTGEREPLTGPTSPGLPLPKDEQYLQFPLHAIVATQALQTETMYMRATYFRALEDLGVETGADNEQTDELRATARKGEASMIETLVNHGADPRAADLQGATPLHIAALWGKLLSLLALIQMNVDVNARDLLNQTPLHSAARGTERSCIEALIKHGSDVHATDFEGRTPLHIAAFHGRTQCIFTLVDAGASLAAQTLLGEHPIHQAACGGAPAGVQALCDCRCDLEATDNEGKKPLEVAAAHGELRTIKTLVTLGADLQGRGRRGRSPLHATADRYRPNAMSLLMDLGADVDASDDDGRTALNAAAYWGYADLMMQLIHAGAQPKDTEGAALTQALKRAEYVMNADSSVLGEILGCTDESIGQEELASRAKDAFERSKASLMYHLASHLEGPPLVPDAAEASVTLPRYIHHEGDAPEMTPKLSFGALSSEPPLTERSGLTVDTGGSWADEPEPNSPIPPEALGDTISSDQLDQRTIMFCEHQKMLWVTYTCAQDRLAKGTSGKYVSRDAHPAASTEMKRGLVALDRIRKILEFESSGDASERMLELPEACPITTHGTWSAALPEKLIHSPVTGF